MPVMNPTHPVCPDCRCAEKPTRARFVIDFKYLNALDPETADTVLRKAAEFIQSAPPIPGYEGPT